MEPIEIIEGDVNLTIRERGDDLDITGYVDDSYDCAGIVMYEDGTSMIWGGADYVTFTKSQTDAMLKAILEFRGSALGDVEPPIELCPSCEYDDIGYCRADEPQTELEYVPGAIVVKCTHYRPDIYSPSRLKLAPKAYGGEA